VGDQEERETGRRGDGEKLGKRETVENGENRQERETGRREEWEGKAKNGGKRGKPARTRDRGDGRGEGKAGNGGKEGKWETRKNARSGDRMKE
jgi:hypothetical protein